MQRFWERAHMVPAEEGGFAVMLDDRPLRLPSGTRLAVPNAALAEALVAEWQEAGGGKGGEFTMEALRLTRLVNTGIDRIAADPAQAAATVAAYGAFDLLCYRAEFPASLAARQHAAWQPLLDWAALALDAPLRVASGVMEVAQEEASLAALARAVAAHPPIPLSALGQIVQSTGSLVLGLAVSHGRIGPEEAHALGALDETAQAEEWGEDAQAMARLAGIREDIVLAARLLALSRETVT